MSIIRVSLTAVYLLAVHRSLFLSVELDRFFTQTISLFEQFNEKKKKIKSARGKNKADG